MALVAPTYLVAMVQKHNDQELANVICVRSDTPIIEGLVAVYVGQAWTATDSFVDCQVQDLIYDRLEVRRIDTAGETVVVPTGDITMPSTGSVVGDPVDPGSCLGFTLRTGIGGRSYRGRLYLGCVGRGGLDGFSTQWDLVSSPGSTYAGAADTFKSELVGSATPLAWAVYSRKLDVANNVTSTVCRTSVLSQNPRARRYGVV